MDHIYTLKPVIHHWIALIVCLVLIVSCATATAGSTEVNETLHVRLDAIRYLASQIAPLLHEYFRDRECWSNLTERFHISARDTCGKKNLALQIRSLLQTCLRKHGAEFGYVALGGFALLIERRIEDDGALDEWRKANPWDMYKGPFKDLRLGDSVDREIDLEKVNSRVSTGVPVERDGEFVGAVYLFFSVATDDDTDSTGPLDGDI